MACADVPLRNHSLKVFPDDTHPWLCRSLSIFAKLQL